MKKPGYIYVAGWDKFQHYHDRAPSWIKLHLALLGNDAWLELPPEDSKLLITIWMLTARYGNGRVPADEKWLCAQAGITWGPRSRRLERLQKGSKRGLSGAQGPSKDFSNDLQTVPKDSRGSRNHEGFIKVLSRRALEPVYPKRTTEGSKEPKRKKRARGASAAVAAPARVQETNGHEPDRDNDLNREGIEMLGRVLKALP